MFKSATGSHLSNSAFLPRRALLLSLVFSSLFSPIRAQDKELEELIITAPKEGRGLGRGKEGISLHNSENKSANKISDIIEKQRGARVTRYGAPGSFSALSIRGANPNQTGVYIDGFPLNDVSGASVNLENLPLELFQSLNFYRSYTPLQLPGIHIGGAIDLIPRALSSEESLWLIKSRVNSLGGGSLGLGLLANSTMQYVRFEGSQNHYDYLDHNGTTLFNTEDDRIRKRENEDYHAYGYSGLFYLHPKGDKRSSIEHSFKFLLDVWGKERGLPGPVGSPLKGVRLEEEQGVFQASHRLSFNKHVTLDSALGLELNTSQVRDPEKELIYALAEQKSKTTRGNFNLSPNFYFFEDRLKIQALVNASQSQIKREEEKLAERRAQNIGLGISYTQIGWGELLLQSKGLYAKDKEGEALDDPLFFTKRSKDTKYELQSSHAHLSIFIWELMQSVFAKTHNTKQGKKKKELELYVSFGKSERIPSLVEAYGDGSNIVGNPELETEKARTQSYGIESKFVIGKGFHFNLSLSYFQTQSERLILFAPNSPYTVRAVNAEEALLSGYEAEIGMEWKELFSSKVRFTQLYARDSHPGSPFEGNFLPLRPRYSLEWYIESGAKNWRPFANLHWLGALFRDRQNSERKFVEERARFDLGLNYYFDTKQVNRLGLIIKNISNEYHSDVLDYPLPNRSYEIQYYQEFK